MWSDTLGTQSSSAKVSILGDELNASPTRDYLDTFFIHVHPKNLIRHETSVRRPYGG